MDKVNILGVGVDVIDRPQLLQRIDELAAEPGVSLVNNVNAHACNLACSDPKFHQILNESDVVFCDGFGVKLAAKMKGHVLGERMTPPDWINDFFEQGVQKKYNVYFVGDEAAVVGLMVEMVKEKYPGLNVVGFHHGFFELDGCENIHLMDEIRQLDADIILTGMGMPRQEKWAWQAKQRIGKGVVIATGALFRWYTGVEKRAPQWVTRSGLEWLARLVMSPRRHFKRYVVGLPLFFIRVLRQKDSGA